MTTQSNWNDWLREWLQRHPIQDPPAHLQHNYVQEVLAKIQASENPSRAVAWRPRLQLGWRFALGGTLAAALAVTIALVRPPRYPAQQIEQDAQILLEVGGVTFYNDADLEEEAQVQDRIVLAEAEEEETLRLREELEEAGANPAEGEASSDEEWLRELQSLDEEEIALS